MNEARLFIQESREGKKRSVNRRGGPTLPDLKDRQRTVRTLVVSSVIPGAAETIEESRIYKRVGGLGRKRGGIGAGDISDSSDSEDSAPDSPAMTNLNQGTARTRGMRGAATQAQQRMAQIGRSETPEAAILHHHETRTSARRFGGRDAREESVDDTKFMIKLRMPKDRFRRLVRDLKSGNRPANLQQTPSYNRSQSGFGTPAPGAMGPPSTPGVQNSQLGTATTPAQVTPGQSAGQIGRLDAPPPPGPGQPPHPQVSFLHFLSYYRVLRLLFQTFLSHQLTPTAFSSDMADNRPGGSQTPIPQGQLRRNNALYLRLG